MMRKLITLLLLIPAIAFSQTPISGIVNRYAAVTNINYCTGYLTVSDPSNFSAGNRVLLIQMKGAVINTSNTSAFGAINQMASAGKYEWGTVQSVTGNEVRLQFALVNNYDLTGSIQLVYVPQFATAQVSGTMTAPAWNGTTGGILTMEVSGQLSLGADIDLSGKGFRGGIASIAENNNCSWLVNQNNYFYPLNNWRGAAKGEGIAAFVNGTEAGRGSQANGGGGGNDHNSGGGGGGQLSAGGQGGINNEPATFGCNGAFPGLGGRAITDASFRLYLGGGGGAGHENNDLGSNGGNGGGIIFIVAGSMEGNGHKIQTNGMDVANSLSDGAGGGGAGGTIIISASSVSNLILESKGGHGGNANNSNTNRCMGPGGGGSGGRIVVPAGVTVPAANISAGQSGQSINSTTCPTSSNGAQPGQPGQSETLQLPFPEGNALAAAPSIVLQPTSTNACTGDTIILSSMVTGAGLSYQWQINTGAGFQNISNNNIYSGAQSNTLEIRSLSAAFSGYQYRLVVNSVCFTSTTSQPAALTVAPAPVAAFALTITGGTVQFSNTSQGASSYSWFFGDGGTSQQASPAHVYNTSGAYTVQLIALSACGADTSVAVVNIPGAPTAGVTATPQAGCAPLSVSFNSSTSINADGFMWTFPGGQPASSTLPSPQVNYNAPGTYDVRLIAMNPVGIDTLFLTAYVTVFDSPVATFSALPSGGLGFNFSNASQGATSYQWNFGDGNSSTSLHPTHTYASAGFYTVTLTAINGCGSNTFIVPVIAGQTPSAIFGQSVAEGCAPMVVQFYDQSTGDYTSRQWSFPGGNPAVSSLETPNVIYSTPGTYDVTLTLNGPLGTISATRSASVIAYAFPEPAFTYSINGNTVTFMNTSSNAASYSWLFGDGNSSQASSPVHTYTSPGVYTVTLNAQRPFCAASSSATVFITTTSTGEAGDKNEVLVFPNPVSSILTVRWKEENNSRSHYRLWNVTGRPVAEGNFAGQVEIDVRALPAGFYALEVEEDGRKYLHRVLKVR